MGDFMPRQGWTFIPEPGQSSSTPQSSLSSLSQPNHNEQPRTPSLFEFEKLMFQYLMKQGGPESLNSTVAMSLLDTAMQTLLYSQAYTQGPTYVMAPLRPTTKYL